MKVITFVGLMAAVVLLVSCHVDGRLPFYWRSAPYGISRSHLTNGYSVRVALNIRGDQDPRMALGFRMGDENGPFLFNYVVLSSARMTADTSGTIPVFGLDLSDVQHILDNAATMLVPLQERGIRVLLQVRNGGDGWSFANLPFGLPSQSFARLCRDVKVLYGLDGLEFYDTDGGVGAHPGLDVPNFFDPTFDFRHEPGVIGTRIPDIATVNIYRDPEDINNHETITFTPEEKVHYFWNEGGLNFTTFLSYFREWEEWRVPPGTRPGDSILGLIEDTPVFVREAGFASGHNVPHPNPSEMFNLFGSYNSFLPHWIRGRPGENFHFVAINETLSFVIHAQPFPSFGWDRGDGVGGMPALDALSHFEYSPSVLNFDVVRGMNEAELSYFSEQVRVFSERFANGDWYNFDNVRRGIVYGLLYFENVKPEDIGLLSIASNLIFGDRRVDPWLGWFEALEGNGPDIVFAPFPVN